MRNTDIKSSKKHQNHHQRPCCHILKGQHQKKDEEHKHQIIKIITKGLVVTLQPGQHQKKDEENTNIKSSKFIKIITKGLIVTLQPVQHQKKDEENTNIKSSKFIKIITKGLVVTLQPGQHQKKDEKHKHQMIKIHQINHQRSCCHIAAGSTSKEG